MPTEIQGVKLYTVKEASQELQVSKNTIHAWIKSGKLTGQRLGKLYFITDTSIKRMMGPLLDD